MDPTIVALGVVSLVALGTYAIYRLLRVNARPVHADWCTRFPGSCSERTCDGCGARFADCSGLLGLCDVCNPPVCSGPPDGAVDAVTIDTRLDSAHGARIVFLNGAIESPVDVLMTCAGCGHLTSHRRAKTFEGRLRCADCAGTGDAA